MAEGEGAALSNVILRLGLMTKETAEQCLERGRENGPQGHLKEEHCWPRGTAAANTPVLVENLQGAVVIGEQRVRGRVV